MAEPMVFSAQHPSEMMVEEPGRDTNPETHYKRARSNHEEPTAMPPRGRVDSFKSKLIGATNPSTWLGFGTGKERITIGDSDLQFYDRVCAGLKLLLDSNSGIRVYFVVKESERAAIVNKQGYFPSNISLETVKRKSVPKNMDGLHEFRKLKVNEDKRGCFPSKKPN
ncbi:hypothetical protein ACOSQ3_000017 [Xanthoceras sorbifolium]